MIWKTPIAAAPKSNMFLRPKRSTKSRPGTVMTTLTTLVMMVVVKPAIPVLLKN